MKWIWWLLHIGKAHHPWELEEAYSDHPFFIGGFFARLKCKKCGRRFVSPAKVREFSGGTNIQTPFIYEKVSEGENSTFNRVVPVHWHGQEPYVKLDIERPFPWER